MEFGIMQSGTFGHPPVDRCRELVRTAESAGFDAFCFGDHVAFPSEMTVSNHSGAASGDAAGDAAGDVAGDREQQLFAADAPIYEVFDVLSYLAGVTETIDLGTNVAVIPYRHPVLLAKEALTVEHLSDGRFELGVGVGWSEREYELLDVPFEERGSRSEEFLELFEKARTEGTCAHEGRHHDVPETGFYPQPEPGRPPVWVGGQSGPAYRRVAAFGTGWTAPSVAGPAFERERERLLDAWRDFDREGDPEIAVMFPLDSVRDSEVGWTDPPAERAGEIVETVRRFDGLGATRVVFAVRDLDPGPAVEYVEQLGRGVLPAVEG